MKRIGFIHIASIAGIIGFCLVSTIYCIAEEETGRLSGTVLNIDGKPVNGLTIVLRPALIVKGSVAPVPILSTYPTALTSKTDVKGTFSFTDIEHGPTQIVIPTQVSEVHFEPDYEIVSIKINNITLYQLIDSPFGDITFSVKPDIKIENVTVTVQQRKGIRTRLLLKNGEPLANAQISYLIEHAPENQNNPNFILHTFSGKTTTNAEGYFVYYFGRDERSTNKNLIPGPYTVTVKSNSLSAKSEAFMLENGSRYDGLVLTFNTDMVTTKPSSSSPTLLSKARSNFTNTPKQTDKLNVEQPQKVNPSKKMRRPRSKSLWIVNPSNGHAYKRIKCKSLEDAKKQARAAEAYLVAINDEAEQKWISGIFGNHLYWIGLSDSKTEGKWIWQNGESMIYTNWARKHRFPRSSLSPEQQDAAVMTFVNGIWHAVGPGDLFWRETKQAILEKSE